MHKGSQKKEYECANCGSTFTDYPSRREGRGRESFYCSKECKSKDEQVEKHEVTCAWCGADITKYPSSMGEVDGSTLENHFCNKECESQHRQVHWTGENNPAYSGGNVEVICEECGDAYTVKPSVSDETRFCSNECQDKNQTDEAIELACDWCGDEFEQKAYDVKGESVFCSSKCFSDWMSDERRGDGNPQWRGGKVGYYGESWNEQRRIAVDNADYACELCGMSRNEHYDEYGIDLDVHHRIPVRSFDEPDDANFQSNLVVACRNCHMTKLEAEPTPHSDVVAP